jgi:hypothetical protein
LVENLHFKQLALLSKQLKFRFFHLPIMGEKLAEGSIVMTDYLKDRLDLLMIIAISSLFKLIINNY